MSEFEIFSAVLGVSLRPLFLSCRLTQRTLRYAENAERIEPDRRYCDEVFGIKLNAL